MSSIYDWSVTPASNASSDTLITWAEGQAPSTVNNSARQVMGRIAEFIGDVGGSLSAGGTADGLTVTANSGFTAYANGLMLSFRATATNTGPATLSVNSVGAKSIRKRDVTGDLPLVAGDIKNTLIYTVQYSTALNGGSGAWLLVGSLPLSSDAVIVSTDAGAAGPTLTGFHNSASPAASDIPFKVIFRGKDSAANDEDYAEIYAQITDPTSASEDADFIFRNKVGGTMATFLSSAGSNLIAAAQGGGIFFRPNGVASVTGQAVLATTGELTVKTITITG